MTPYMNSLISYLKLNKENDIVNSYKFFTEKYFKENTIIYKTLEFKSFHPFFSIILKEHDDYCKFETVYCNENYLFSLFLVKNNLHNLEKEVLLYNFYDEVSSILIANYYLDPENHFTTFIEIDKSTNTNDIVNSDEFGYYFLEGKVEEVIPNRKVIIRCSVYYVSKINNLINHEKYSSFRITFKSGKPIKF